MQRRGQPSGSPAAAIMLGLHDERGRGAGLTAESGAKRTDGSAGREALAEASDGRLSGRAGRLGAVI